MTQKFDAIIVGGGHNGLTCAAYLARAGRKVLVLEQRHVLGGAAVSEEIFPGFTYSVCSYVVSLLRPEVIRELELAKYGLKIHPLDSVFAPMENGDGLVSYADENKARKEFSRFSPRDAEMLTRFHEVMYKMAFAVKPIIGYVPPNISKPSLRDLGTLKEFGQHLQGLGKDTFHELSKIMVMSVDDFLAEYFETDIIRAAHGLSGIIGTMLGVRSPGTAYVLLHHYMGELDGAFTAWGGQQGGTGEISNAIADSARSHGAEIRVSAPVAQVIVKNGSAVGVALENGDEFYADTVVSGCDPKVTFRKLVDEKDLPADLVHAIDKFKYRGSSGKVNLALDGLPEFTAMKDPSLTRGLIDVCVSVRYIEKAYDDAKYGGFSKRPCMEIVIPSTVDPTMAPRGKHMMSIFVQYAAYDMSEYGNRDQQREAFGNAVIDTLSEFAPNLKDLILHKQVLTPWDLEQTYGLTEGNIFHGELSLEQLAFLRPMSGWARYKTPIKNLWMCASGTHPGGGVMGAPGALCARTLLESRNI